MVPIQIFGAGLAMFCTYNWSVWSYLFQTTATLPIFPQFQAFKCFFISFGSNQCKSPHANFHIAMIIRPPLHITQVKSLLLLPWLSWCNSCTNYMTWNRYLATKINLFWKEIIGYKLKCLEQDLCFHAANLKIHRMLLLWIHQGSQHRRLRRFSSRCLILIY